MWKVGPDNAREQKRVNVALSVFPELIQLRGEILYPCTRLEDHQQIHPAGLYFVPVISAFIRPWMHQVERAAVDREIVGAGRNECVIPNH